MSPALFLAIMVALSAIAWIIQDLRNRRHQQNLRTLASQWQMNYSRGDQLRLAHRVVEKFPVPGVADLQVRDLIYGADENRLRYIFTAEYTRGVIFAKRRMARAVGFCEPRDATSAASASHLVLAAPQLTLIEQYHDLHRQITCADAPVSRSLPPEPIAPAHRSE